MVKSNEWERFMLRVGERVITVCAANAKEAVALVVDMNKLKSSRSVYQIKSTIWKD
jgi:hypothetical protein